MFLKVSASEAKANLSGLISHVESGGQSVVIERRGKPAVALVSMDDLAKIIEFADDSDEPRGALGLVGAWGMLEDSEIDDMIEAIYAARTADTGRPVDLG